MHTGCDEIIDIDGESSTIIPRKTKKDRQGFRFRIIPAASDRVTNSPVEHYICREKYFFNGFMEKLFRRLQNRSIQTGDQVILTDELFHEKLTRDLKFLLHRPLLVSDPNACSLQQKMRQSVESFIAKDPRRLPRMLAQPHKNLPLGKWFEEVLGLALKIEFPFHEFFHGVPTADGGELDFLIQDAFTVNHIECAVKFYLHRPHLGLGSNSFVGPEGKDRLDLKEKKMRDIQLKRLIPELLGSTKSATRTLWMSGQLLEPLNENLLTQLVMEREIVPFWTTVHQFSLIRDQLGHVVKLPKQWWITDLTGLTKTQIAKVNSPNQDINEFRPFMIAIITFDGDFATEIGRGIIVEK